MSIDKKIDYVDQDGYKNYTKNSKSVTVPKEFKARKNAPATKLAYITAKEEKQLKKQNPGTPHKGPSNVPSYDSFDAQGSYTSGSAMSAAETGSSNARDRAEVRASNIGAPRGAGPGVRSNQERDLRSATIAAGAGQRVNPRFFDSRNTVSPAELARARAFNPAAFKAGRRGGIMDFFTGGGFLGNIVRGLGQKFGLGKKFNEPTYDMSRFNKLGLGGLDPFANLDIRDIYDRRKTDEEDTDTSLGKIIMEARANNSLRRNPDYDYLGPNLNEGIFMDYQELDESGSGKVNTTDKFIVPFKGARTIMRNPNYIEPGGTVLEDEFPSTTIPEMRDLGNPYADPRIVPEERGLEPGPTPFTLEDRMREEGPKLGIGSDFYRDLKNYLTQAGNQGIMQLAEVSQKDIDASKARGFNKLDRDTAVTLGLISPDVTEYEFEQLKQGNITEPGTYTA